MPQVASEATSAVFRPVLPPAMRPAPGSESVPDLPFESLLDTDVQAPPPPQASQSTQPPQAPQADPDRTAADNSDSKPAQADGKAPDKAVSKPDDKTAGRTAGKTDDETTDKTTNPIQVLGAEPAAGANGDEAANSSDNAKTVKAPNDSNATQVLVQPAVQPVAQMVDDTKATDAIDAIAAIVAPTTPKPAGETKAKTDTKLGEMAKDADTAKPDDGTQGPDAKASGDVKPTGGPVPVIAATDQTIAPVQTVAPIAVAPATPAPAVTLTSTAPEISQAAPLVKPTVTVTDKPAAEPKAKTGDFAALQDDAQKLAAPAHEETPVAAPHAPADKPAAVTTDASNALPKTTGDAVQQSSLTPATPDVTQMVAPPPPAAPAPLAVQAAPVPLAGVAVEIAIQAQSGKNHFEIRLDPPELGRIEVRLDVDRDGRVTSRLIVDRSDTLALLRNDAAGLQRALQDAGLKTADNGLQFSLRDQSMGQQQNPALPTPNTTQIVVQDNTLPAGELPQAVYSRLADLRGGIDIRV